MVHGAGEVLVEDERRGTRFAEATIGKADTVSFDELRRRGLVGVEWSSFADLQVGVVENERCTP